MHIRSNKEGKISSVTSNVMGEIFKGANGNKILTLCYKRSSSIY